MKLQGTHSVASKHSHEHEQKQSSLHEGSTVGWRKETKAREDHQNESRHCELNSSASHHTKPSCHLFKYASKHKYKKCVAAVFNEEHIP